MDKISTFRKNILSAFIPWWIAFRPRTLPISIPPVLLGTALAYQQGVGIKWHLSLLVLLCSFCLQIGVNLINDALDFKKGADASDRLGPQRVTQGGLLHSQTVLTGGVFCLFLAFLCSLPLIVIGGKFFIFIILCAISCAYLYTGGPFPLAYHGLGEVFVFIFFGLVSSFAVYYLQVGTIFPISPLLVAATQIGLLAVVPCAINNIRDSFSDARVNKKTLAVRFGEEFARREIYVLSLVPFLFSFFWVIHDCLWMAFLPFFSLFFIGKNLKKIKETPISTDYNEFLAISAQCQLLFASLLTIGCIQDAH